MTTRVLQAFHILDNRSKSTLDRFAKKNNQLTQMSTHCFAHGRSATGLGLHYEFRARKKPKANKDIINEEQDLLYKRLRKSLSVAASMQSSSRSKSVEAGSSRVVMHPETHAEKSSPRHFMSRGKEEGGLRSLPKRPQTLQLCTESPRRTTWSREVEKVPSLRELTKVNRSKALVGISLGNADICHWCSRSVHGEVNAPFKSAQLDGSMKTQQLQENTDNTNTITSTLQNKTENEVYVEPVPLTFDDLLKREDVTVLTPRLPEAFLSQQKASETSPVVYSTRQRHYEPFSGPGFHSLEGASQIRQRNLRSAIILYTEAMQANYMIRSMREKQTGECLRSRRPYTQAGVKSKKTGVKCVGMCVLKADGKVIRSPDNTRLPLHYRDEAPSLCASRCPDKALTSKQNASSLWVGPVINGMNPNRTCDSGKTSPASCKSLPASPRRGYSGSAHISTPVSQWSRSKNKADFLSISRPLKSDHSQNDVICITTEKPIRSGSWRKQAREPYENITGCDLFSVHDMRSGSRQSGGADTTRSPRQTEVNDMINSSSTTDSEKTPQLSASSCKLEMLNILTTDYLD